MKHDRKSQRAQICFSLLWWESAFTASFQYFSNHARSSNYSNLVRLDVNTNKVASQLQGPSWKMCSVDKSFTIVTLSLELFDEINGDLHLAKFKVTSSSQLWLDACATGSHALHYAPQTCQHNSIKISTSSRIRLRGYWMRKAQLIWVQLQLIWVWFFECALGHVDQIYIYMYIYVDICDVDLHVQI